MNLHKKSFFFIFLNILFGNKCPQQSFVEQNVFLSANNSIFEPKMNRANYTKKNGITTVSYMGKKVSSIKDISKKDNTESIKYFYKGYIEKIKMHLLTIKQYESTELLLISNTGNKYKLSGDLYISPDNKYIISVSQGIEFQLMPNGIQIFKLSPGRMESVCNLKMINEEPLALKWINDSSFVVKCRKTLPNGGLSNMFVYIKYNI